MKTRQTIRTLISWLLISALFCTTSLPVFAAELPEEPLPVLPEPSLPTEPALPDIVLPETTLPIPGETLPPATESTIPPATMPETLPAETIPVTEAATLPAETAPVTQPLETLVPTVPEPTVPVTEETLPPETVPETLPPETQSPTIPETQPAPPVQTEPALSPETEPTLPSEPEETRPVQVMTIAQAQTMAAGTEGITIQGTVVYADEFQAVLQDDTGGIRLSFPEASGTAVGEILLVTGTRTAGLAVEDFAFLGLGDLPCRKSSLLDAPEELRLEISGAQIAGDQLRQSGFSMTLAGELPALSSQRVDVWGVILDGCFYADAAAPSKVPEAAAASADGQSWNLYFGQLHVHTEVTDPITEPLEAFTLADSLENMDFFAITNASSFFEKAAFGNIAFAPQSETWEAGQQAAEAASHPGFLAIFGYEVNWGPEQVPGHISTFNTPGWQTKDQPGMETLEKYYAKLAAVPQSVSQFNHPGPAFGDFNHFSQYDPAYDRVMQLLELDPDPETATKYYDMALERGWHLAPTLSGGDTLETIGQVRTAVLAENLSSSAVFSAMQNLRVYATTDPDFRVIYKLNGQIQGSTIGTADTLTAEISLSDPTDRGSCTVEVISAGEPVATHVLESLPASCSVEVPVGHPYYYLRITQADGEFAVTAPVWVDDYGDIGVRGFVSSEAKPMEEQEILLSLELYNQEQLPFVLEKMEFFANDSLVHSLSDPGRVEPLSILPYSFPVTWEDPGQVTFRAEITGTVDGAARSFEQTLTLVYQAKEAEASTIAAVRQGIPGTIYRVRGYITAGNDNPYTTFPNTLYVQDDTGGIAVVGYQADTFQVGCPVEVTGILAREGGNLVLKLTGCTLTEGNYYRYAPLTSSNDSAMNAALHGGQLMQVEGEVVSVKKTADGKGISRLTLKDPRGDLATVVIEDGIRSGAYGTNTLASQVKKGRTVRALGLVHRDEFSATVLRVRNCDEVVYVPARRDYSNPGTGDPLWFLPAWLLFWI